MAHFFIKKLTILFYHSLALWTFSSSLGQSHGLVVKGRDSWSRGWEFESKHLMDHFHIYFICCENNLMQEVL